MPNGRFAYAHLLNTHLTPLRRLFLDRSPPHFLSAAAPRRFEAGVCKQTSGGHLPSFRAAPRKPACASSRSCRHYYSDTLLGAAAEIQRLAENLGAPVVMTVNARGLLPPQHPLAVSLSPSLAPVRALIAAADAVVAVGTELGPTDYDMYSAGDFPRLPQLIRIDVEAQQLERNAHPSLALHGHARE